MKTVSVIIPVYNMENYLEECLNSVISQTLNDFEIICINDGSTDSSLRILQKYAENNEYITVINQTNQGVSAARNAGLLSAKSDYVCFMDPDDFYPDEDVLKDLYYAAKAHNALICGGSFSRYNDKTKEKTVQFDGFYQKYTFSEDDLVSYENYQYDYGYHRFLYSLHLLKRENIEFPPYKRFQDPPFFVRAMIAAKEFYALRRVVYCYRIGHQSVKWNEEKLAAFINGVSDNLKISSEKHLNDLHAVTVQRIIEQKRAFEANQIVELSDEVKSSFFKMLLYIRMDMLKSSTYNIDMNQLLKVLKVGVKSDTYKNELEDWKYQCCCVKNSKTFRVGEAVLYIPKKIYYFFKR